MFSDNHSEYLAVERDGVYQTAGESEPIFHETPPPSTAQLQALLGKIINRLMKLLTRTGHLIEEEGVVYLADTDPDNVLAPLQAASCTYRIAQGPRAGQKVLRVLSLQRGYSLPFTHTTQALCVNAHGPSTGSGRASAFTQACAARRMTGLRWSNCAVTLHARPSPTKG